MKRRLHPTRKFEFPFNSVNFLCAVRKKVSYLLQSRSPACSIHCEEQCTGEYVLPRIDMNQLDIRNIRNRDILCWSNNIANAFKDEKRPPKEEHCIRENCYNEE